MGLLRFGGGGEGSGDRRLRGKEGCLVHGGGRGGEGEIGVLLQHGRKMCTRLCSGLWLLLWRSGLVWRSSRGTSLLLVVNLGIMVVFCLLRDGIDFLKDGRALELSNELLGKALFIASSYTNCGAVT